MRLTGRFSHGSVAAMEAVRKAKKPSIRIACEAASCVLWNTPAIARKSYVHPTILDLVATDHPAETIAALNIRRTKGLVATEQRLMALIAPNAA